MIRFDKILVMSRPFIFLRANTEEIRTRLRNEGFWLCSCAEFSNSVWLNGVRQNSGRIEVHGVGYADASDDYWNQPSDVIVERTLEDERDCGNEIVDCGTDVERFINATKRLI